MGLYRKRPVVIEAFRWTGGPDQTEDPVWIVEAIKDGRVYYQGGDAPYLTIEMLEGAHRANVGDWIIKGIKGELYPCKPDIFAATYEAAQEQNVSDPYLNHESVLLEIARERERQMDGEGWTPEHDDKHNNFEMARAAACYALGRDTISRDVGSSLGEGVYASMTVRIWPWDREWWKPKNKRADMIRAAALLVAEIERLDRERDRRNAAVAAMARAI